MKTDLVMPQMGESVAEGTVTKWYVKIGDTVKKDQTVLSISTDKVDAEIPAPSGGVLSEILVQEGEKVSIGTVLARIDTEAKEAEAVRTPAAETPVSPPRQMVQPEPEVKEPVSTKRVEPRKDVAPPTPPPPKPPPAAEQAKPAAPAQVQPPSGMDRAGYYSPLVLNIAREEGVSPEELASIQGSGLGGRVQKRDILGYVESRKAGKAPAAAPAPAAPPAPAPAAPAPLAPSAPAAVSGPEQQVVEMDTMRRAIAEHMVRSVQTSPHVTSLHEVDMTRLVKAREAIKKQFEAREGFSLTYTTFFVAAAARALRSFPNVNASIEGTKVLQKRRVNIGVAVALEGGGLIVPVVKNADTMNLVGLARVINDLVTRARARKLSPDDVSGGTFTITNLGSAGSLTGTPIINQPQVAIMGIGIIKKRPVVIDDMIAIRDMMYLSMSYDHRIVDGMLAGQFLSQVTKSLETMDVEI